MSTQIAMNMQTIGLFLPLLAFGDQILDVIFVVNNWDLFIYKWFRYACVAHLLVISIVQFLYGFFWITKTNLGQGWGFRFFWGFLTMTNLNESYLYWTTKRCCSCYYCGGSRMNTKFYDETEKMLEILFFIHAFGEDLIQVIIQWAHLITTAIEQGKYGKYNASVLDVVSLLFGTMFLGFGIIYFLLYTLIWKRCCKFRPCCGDKCSFITLIPEKAIQTQMESSSIQLGGE